MAVPLKKPNPLLADINCTRLSFQPGDRILVRVYTKLDNDQIKKLKQSIIRWAGCDVEVFVYDARIMDIVVDRPKPTFQSIDIKH